MGESFENVGVAEMASSRRSIRFLYRNSDFESYFYCSVKDLENLLSGRKKTATLWKPKQDIHPERATFNRNTL
jgi:hypothetical protein